MPMTFEAKSASIDINKNNIEESSQKSVTIRSFFPETWLWTVQESE